jgi:hypothetical protein
MSLRFKFLVDYRGLADFGGANAPAGYFFEDFEFLLVVVLECQPNWRSLTTILMPADAVGRGEPAVLVAVRHSAGMPL